VKFNIPLAELYRPQNLDDFFGQEKILAQNSFLRKAIESDKVPSLIFWGPPGTGKTTLARIIAQKTKADFVQLSAVSSGKKELFKIIETAQKNNRLGQKTILFIDEIHRWNKAQQDALLPFVESGLIVLIGATTENPSFEVNAALLSRSRVLVFEKLSQKDLGNILNKVLEKLGADIKIKKDAKEFLLNFSNGDARAMLNTLEICLQHSKQNSKENKEIDLALVKEVFQKQHLLYDKNGQQHYELISALHKSMRGGNPHAALYYLARMLEGGEDPLYIARRLVRFAAEDVGLADNHALILANAVFEACRNLGMPECEVHLAQAVVYLAKTKKSILAYEALGKAKQDVKNFGNLPIPLYLRNAPTKLMKDLGFGKDYKYTPKEDDSGQEYFPEKLKGRKYF